MVAIVKRPSPNFNARPEGRQPDMLLMHYTGMKTGGEALARMCDGDSQVAAHYMVDIDGTIYQLIDETERAWHAGVASWGSESNINSASIGVEIVNPGHEFGYTPFPDVQMAAVTALSKEIIERHNIKPVHVLGHSDVAPTRKQDPGELFNWQMLAQEAVGFWPQNVVVGNEDPLSSGMVRDQVTVLQEQLVAIGYSLDITGCYDITTIAVVTAFQRHWRQSKIDGVADAETQATMRAVSHAVFKSGK